MLPELPTKAQGGLADTTSIGPTELVFTGPVYACAQCIVTSVAPGC